MAKQTNPNIWLGSRYNAKQAIIGIPAGPTGDDPGILFLESNSSAAAKGGLYIWTDSNGAIRYHTAKPTDEDGGGTILIAGATPQTLTGAGAVNLTTAITWVVTTGANALTLADGAEGQWKHIVMKTDGGDGTLTPTHLGNGTTITFNDAGDCCSLLFTNSNWYMIGGTATLA